jgi:hypothetical protein
MGTGEASVSYPCLVQRDFWEPEGVAQVAEYIAECHRILEKSGLTFKVKFGLRPALTYFLKTFVIDAVSSYYSLFSHTPVNVIY